VLAVGTANPANCIPQHEYADWYFRVTKSDHLTHLKDAMKKTCENEASTHHAPKYILLRPNTGTYKY
jgi:metal-dependent amidase/aminoacylase/carboxypeptidase family protein